MITTEKRPSFNIKLPFDRPEPIKPESITEFNGFRLSQDENPAKFVIRARYIMEFSLFKCFKIEQEAWREAAYWAVENGHDPTPYIALAQKRGNQ